MYLRYGDDIRQSAEFFKRGFRRGRVNVDHAQCPILEPPKLKSADIDVMSAQKCSDISDHAGAVMVSDDNHIAFGDSVHINPAKTHNPPVFFGKHGSPYFIRTFGMIFQFYPNQV